MSVLQKIGTTSAANIAELDDLIQKVRQPDFAEIDKSFISILEKLHREHARVSVVGQVKAGKSTLINAFTGMNDFLPTEVNPWTAVITDLHFGHAGRRENGGEFQLFSEDEWARMLDGDSETRQLAVDLLPGFNTDILKEQVEEMRENAKKRLGSLYKHLLGRKHEFNLITPEILERYVSAGHANNTDPSSTAGKFSGITKSAAVFMPPGPFAIPVTISDTPGINDPFLVRDEITTSSFRRADIFIVALSVHQALNMADIALLKMLSVHTGKKTVIFVNRCDEVDAPSEVVPDVLSALDERLREELDHPNFTLIAGSAAWGSIATIGSDSDVAAAMADGRVREYCKTLDDTGHMNDRDRLFAASGLKKLSNTLSDIIEAGPTRALLSETVSEISATLALLKNMLNENLSRSEEMLENGGDAAKISERERERISEHIDRHSIHSNDLKSLLISARQHLFDNGDAVFKSVENTINAATNSFIDSQTADMRQHIADTESKKRWRLDTGDIRSRVEAQVTESYASGRNTLDALLTEHAMKIQEVMDQIGGNVPVDSLLENLPHDQILPSFKPKTTLVEVELGKDRGWKFWQRSKLTDEEAVERIRKVFRAEMFPAIENLRSVAREAIAERTDAGLDRLMTITNTAQALVASEVSALEAELDILVLGTDETTINRINEERAQRSINTRKRIAELETAQHTIAERFGDITPPEPRDSVISQQLQQRAVG